MYTHILKCLSNPVDSSDFWKNIRQFYLLLGNAWTNKMHRLNAMVKNICQMHKCINSNISTSVLMRDYIFCSAHSSQRVNVYGNLFQGIMVILLMTRQWMDVIFCVLSRKGSYFHATLCLWLCLFLQGGRSAVQHWQHAWSEEEEDHSSGQRSGEKPTAKPQKVYLIFSSSALGRAGLLDPDSFSRNWLQLQITMHYKIRGTKMSQII